MSRALRFRAEADRFSQDVPLPRPPSSALQSFVNVMKLKSMCATTSCYISPNSNQTFSFDSAHRVCCPSHTCRALYLMLLSVPYHLFRHFIFMRWLVVSVRDDHLAEHRDRPTKYWQMQAGRQQNKQVVAQHNALPTTMQSSITQILHA